MKFIIKKTTNEVEEESVEPCKGIKKELATHCISLNCKTIEEAERNIWFKGQEKIIEDGVIKVLGKKATVYTIEIDSIEKLIKLYEKEGDLKISKSFYKEVPLEIEIL